MTEQFLEAAEQLRRENGARAAVVAYLCSLDVSHLGSRDTFRALRGEAFQNWQAATAA
jgi:hypothetical protein